MNKRTLAGVENFLGKYESKLNIAEEVEEIEEIEEVEEVTAEEVEEIKTESAKELLALAKKVASLKKEMPTKLKALIAKKVTKIANRLEVVAADEEEEVVEGIAKAIKTIYNKKNDYNKMKNKKVKDIITNSGQEILNMKVVDFFEMIANI